MKRWSWVLILPALAIIVAFAAFRPWAKDTQTTLAHVGTGAAHLELDLVKDGDDWCNPVHDAAYVDLDAVHQVAVCLSDATAPPSAFNFDLTYDDTLNTCAEIACPELIPGTGIYICTDDNPDANDGSTTFTTPDLGSGWDCNGADEPDSEPQCDMDVDTGAGQGKAWMSCVTTSETLPLPVGNGVSSPIAVVAFHAAAGGTDQLMLENVAMGDEFAATILECYGSGPCYGATDTKSGEAPPTNTPPGPSPTSTSTPSCGQFGQPACPTSTPTPKALTATPTAGTPVATQEATAPPPPPPPPPPSGGEQPVVQPPATGSGSHGADWTSLAWMLTAAGAVVISGLYFRRVKNRVK